jgi:hypothetical protein
LVQLVISESADVPFLSIRREVFRVVVDIACLHIDTAPLQNMAQTQNNKKKDDNEKKLIYLAERCRELA